MPEDPSLREKVNEHEVRLGVFDEWRRGVDKAFETFVTKAEFTLVRIIVYSLAGTTLTAVLSALLARVIVK
ncbi:hypothetical protein [Robbsia andropogonis]|uniref:hypothetical protein n=1 Tax=Robbsia andropogonis TaxID=28092 RepID=UPI000464404F|nr:hypothetical protein [Robbsia andropogonis]MCP1119620.1 hypothetical protein [Robbsia andropogonis]MCP1129603.1 hypothetical protein [Robbsia andropogonis]